MKGSKEKQTSYAKKAYNKVKKKKQEKEITLPNEEETAKILQKKKYDKIRNEKKEIKEEKSIHRNLIGSKEKKDLTTRKLTTK